MSYLDAQDDNDSLAPDLKGVAIGYDPATDSYDLLIIFWPPFSGLLTDDQILFNIDTDRRTNTGYPLSVLGLGADYLINIKGSYKGTTAMLWRTPSSDSSRWSLVGTLAGFENTDDDSIFLTIPASDLGSVISFNFALASSWEGIYDTYYDFLPNSGHLNYYRVPVTTTTAPTTTTTIPTTTTTLPPSTTTTTAPSGQFRDVSSGHPYYTQIIDLASRGIVAGFLDGTFQPNSSVTRQQFAKMIVKTLDLPVSEADACPFIDVPTNLPSTDPLYPDHYVAVCAAYGITVGKTSATFAPWEDISRAQLITMVARAAGLNEPPDSYTPPFSAV